VVFLNLPAKEKTILRELAKKVAELSVSPINKERRDRARDVNDLIPRKPIVWLNEFPWHEMDIDGKLRCICEDGFARAMEQNLRKTLYRWEYIQADMVLEKEYIIFKSYDDDMCELEIKENKLYGDKESRIASHEYIDQLDCLIEDNALKLPVVKADKIADTRNLEWANEILDGIMPVRLCGYFFYHAPWDLIIQLHGVEKTMVDLLERPELMHATIKRFTEIGYSRMKQMESEGLLGNGNPDIHFTPAYSSVTTKDQPAQLKDVWFRGAAQILSAVSPAMWDEFELQYAKPLMAEFALVYYGCCEALDNKIPLLRTVPNLRKIGVSPWANPEKCAEQIGGDYVFSYKPNPAAVAGAFDRETTRAEIARVLETCKKNGCPCEFILKDISTISYKPTNLIEWVKTVMSTIDAFFR